ncbi:MAG: phosphatase PAP2 family protein [Acidimicrobiaceae bacterium]|nr:phosphatase PAP2 family protein [Acidimicrobiaceae bacterium]
MSAAPSLLDVAAKSGRRPRWWLEILVIVWLCWVYDAISNLAPLRRVAPYDHARSLLHLERLLHLDPEHALNHWLNAHPTLGWWVSIYYDNAHFVVTLAVLGWLWWRHSGLYRPLRTSIVLINVIGFFVYWRYPMAPPRLTVPAQYPDVVAATHAFGSWHSGTLARHANELAAMPSLHLAWAAWSAYACWKVFRRHRWAWLAWLYPMLTTVAVMATGNHFLGDCVAGVAVMAIATVAAQRWHERWAARRVIHELRGASAVELSEVA